VSGSITLADVAAQASILVVACSRCERKGRYPVELSTRYGAALSIPHLLARLSADCPKRKDQTAYNNCGMYCPDLPALFRRDGR
jgi:hypothetical protein